MSTPRRFFDTLDHEGRFGEWMAAILMFGMGLICALPGNTLQYGVYAAVRDVGFTETFMAWYLGIVGAQRCFALWVNGMFVRTPLVRGMGAILGAVVFLNLSVLTWWEYLSPEGVRTAGFTLVIWPLFLMAEIRGIIRAGRDGANAKLLN